MKQIKETRITPNDGYHYFYGYYDLQPYSPDEKKHLCHRVKEADRLPTAEDVCEVGYIDLDTGVFCKVGQTLAWNFQQGALLQWMDNTHLIYNAYLDNRFCAVVEDICTKERRIIDMPLANLSEDRKWGLSINFARIYDYRPGYGYSNEKDPYADVNTPDNDGVYVVDLEHNTSRLVLSYAEISEKYLPREYKGQKIVVNHISFNPSGERFLMLVRTFQRAESGQWFTILITADRNGENVCVLTDFSVNSHYHWRNDREFMIWSILDQGSGLYLIEDLTDKRTKIEDDYFNQRDIHCLFMSRDTDIFIGDAYPDKLGYRGIFIHSFKSGATEYLLPARHKKTIEDIRCDLHARFNRSCDKISYDYYGKNHRMIREVEFLWDEQE